MATPNTGAVAMKQALSQQGKTPSQSQTQQGAVATPPVSTPFSAAHAAFSPHGPKSSPSQVKKSPATVQSGIASNHPINFDSPSTAAALNALQMSNGLDLEGLNLGALGRSTEDERAKRLDAVINILSQGKGLVSEAGLERLAKRLELEVLWESGMGVDAAKKTLIVGGSAIELSIVFSSRDVVESVSLDFPESADMVKKHTAETSRILTENLKLEKGQSPLTKEMDSFVNNFERIANLDKLSVHPGLNLHEAVAGIYESLHRLHTWEMQKAGQNLAISAKGPDNVQAHVLCMRSGAPSMNARSKVGLIVDYWRQTRGLLSKKSPKIWCLSVGCAPLTNLNVNPVRVSDKWISPEIEKQALPDGLHSGPILDWLEPEPTFLSESQVKQESGADVLQPTGPLAGPRLPEVTFTATFDPPVHISLNLWQRIAESGCGLPEIEVHNLRSFDSLIFPIAPGASYDPSEPRAIECYKEVEVPAISNLDTVSTRTHRNQLSVYKPIYGRTLTEVAFSHPRQIIDILPCLRQYAFLSTLLETSFKDATAEAKPKANPAPTDKATVPNTATTYSKNLTITSNMGDLRGFMITPSPSPPPPTNALEINVTLTVQPVPRLQILFPFKDRMADVVLEIRENGTVHVVGQDVLDESNMVAPNGKLRKVEDLGGLLELMEDIGKWCEFLRTRWAEGRPMEGMDSS